MLLRLSALKLYKLRRELSLIPWSLTMNVHPIFCIFSVENLTWKMPVFEPKTPAEHFLLYLMKFSNSILSTSFCTALKCKNFIGSAPEKLLCCVLLPAPGCCAHPKTDQTTFLQPISTFFVHLKPFSVVSRLKSTKKVWKRVDRPAFGCAPHPKAGQNTQHY